MRIFLLFILIPGCPFAFADSPVAKDLVKCRQKCIEDARNKANWLEIDGRKLTGIESFHFEVDQCSISCTTSARIMEDSKSKQWDPNNPIVQRCFAESGVSDNNISLNNYVTNNCIMRGLAEERQTAGKIPTPTPRPEETNGTTSGLRCDRDMLARLESSCMQAKEASFRACDESRIPTGNAPSQISGQQAACQQTAAYNGQLSDSLGQYISQCQSAKSGCASACLEFSKAVGTYGSGCAGELTGSFHSTASAMTDMCNGMGLKLSLVQQQKAAADQARTNAEQDCQQQVAASSNPSESAGNGADGGSSGMPSTRVGSGPLLSGINTSGQPGSDFNQDSGGEETGSFETANRSSTGSDSGLGQTSVDTSGKKHDSSESSSAEAMQLASLPTRQEPQEMTNADDNETQKSGSDKTAIAGAEGAGIKDGGGSTKSRFRLMRLPGQTGSLGKDSLSEDAVGREPASTETGPDLHRFLPTMGGLKGSRFDGHGPHANLFQKVSERYRLIEPSLLQDFP